ncbi:MAG: HupE/UreJ family protein [Acidobacteria bacterium]|nr:MAG: HupE/UreJ family protein [Acidobacteriota bacterium]
MGKTSGSPEQLGWRRPPECGRHLRCRTAHKSAPGFSDSAPEVPPTFRRFLPLAFGSRALCLLCSTLFIFLFPALGFPHAGNVSYSQITVEETEIRQEIQILVKELLLAVPLDTNQDGKVDPGELQAGRELLTDYLRQKVEVISRDVDLPLRVESLDIGEQEVVDRSEPELFLFAQLVFPSPHPLREFTMRCHLLDAVDIRHHNFAKIHFGGFSRPFVFTPSNTFVYEGGRGRSAQFVAGLGETLYSFGRLGAEHIFSGYDHILFLIGLLLVATRFSNILTVVTAFTLAHSFSLALAALQWVEVASRIVEPLIALSIMYVALENFFSWFPAKRWLISFGFGLIHGLAFAEGLQVLELPPPQFITALLSFNVGIEVAQVIIVALTFPAILAMAKASWRPRAIQGLSSVLFCLGALWLIQRLFW